MNGKLFIGKIQNRKIVWNSVRKLTFDITMTNLCTFQVTIPSRSYDNLMTNRKIFCKSGLRLDSTYKVGQKSKLLILSECVNKTEKVGGMWTNTNRYRENEALSDIFTWNILRHNCFMFKYSVWLKAHNEITARQTRNGFAKFIKVYTEYLTTQIELVLPTFKF